MIRSDIETPMYLQLYHVIVQDIDDGKILSGAALPSERSIARSYGVSRVTVRQAYETLEASGYATRIQGRGTIVL